MSEHHCYACTFREGNYGGSWTQNNRRRQGRAVVYETLVEYVEGLYGTEFSISSAWRGMRDTLGWSDHNMMRHVFRDMVLHGLLICVRRTGDGKCRAYRFSPEVKDVLTG